MSSKYHRPFPPDFYENDGSVSIPDRDGHSQPHSLIGGFRGYYRSLLPPPYDHLPYDDDGSVMWCGWPVYMARLEELRKKEEKKLKAKKKKGIWTDASNPYPWEVQSTKGDDEP